MMRFSSLRWVSNTPGAESFHQPLGHDFDFPLLVVFLAAFRHFSFWSPCLLSGLCWSLEKGRWQAQVLALALGWGFTRELGWSNSWQFPKWGHTPGLSSVMRGWGYSWTPWAKPLCILHSELTDVSHEVWMHSLLGKKKNRKKNLGTQYRSLNM